MREKINYLLEVLRKKYIPYIVLVLVIVTLFSLTDRLLGDIKENYRLSVENIIINTSNTIYIKDDIPYVSIDDLVSIYSSNIYYDKISAKIIFTTRDSLNKISKSDSDKVIVRDNAIYVNLNTVCEYLNKMYVINETERLINVVSDKFVEGRFVKSRVEVYNNADKIVSIVSKGDKVRVLENKDANDKLVRAIIETDGTCYYGKIFKSNVDYVVNNDTNDIDNTKQSSNITFVKASGKIDKSTDISKVDVIAMDMLRVSGVNSLTKFQYELPTTDNKIYAVVTNGQRFANYDNNIITSMLNSEKNREKVQNGILEFLQSNNLDGIVVDFIGLRVSDRDGFMQFIKELAALMHQNDKKIAINCYNDLLGHLNLIEDFVDYFILNTYDMRTTSSNTSGATSSVVYVDKLISDVLNIGIDKSQIIVELGAYSILWIERGGVVINAEIYDMNMIQDYIKANNVEYKIDNTTKQNFFSYTSGITSYKMWIEDEYSIKEKLKVIKEYELAGVSIYKSGMEASSIYKNISEILGG